MKVLTKCVNIENQEFVLIQDESNNEKFYGTIPYSELDENGVMKRELNGLQICISFESPSEAILERNRSIVANRLMKQFKEDGQDEMQCIISLMQHPEYLKFFKEVQ